MNTIRILYFASLREQLGRAQDQVEAAGIATIADVWRRAINTPLPINILVAVNQEYASPESPVQAGDEVAFFPPVTGG